jgi:hypothetical protein
MIEKSTVPHFLFLCLPVISSWRLFVREIQRARRWICSGMGTDEGVCASARCCGDFASGTHTRQSTLINPGLATPTLGRVARSGTVRDRKALAPVHPPRRRRHQRRTV